MSELPPGWTEARLGDVAVIRSGCGFPVDMQGRHEGTFPFAKVGDISRSAREGRAELTTAENYVAEADLLRLGTAPFPPGTVAFAKIGEGIRLNYRALTGRPMLFDNNVMGLVPERDAVCPAFLHKFMQTVDLYPFAVATSIPSVRKSDVAELPLPLPPLPEQRRIVAKLEDLLARSRRAKAALDAIPPLLERLRQSVLAAAFRGDLTADWREKNPDVEPAEKLLARIRVERRKKWEEAELAKMKAKGKAPTDDRWKAKYVEPEPVDESELPELPEGWCWTTMEQLSGLITSGSRGWAEYYSDTGPLFIRSQDINSDTLRLEDVAHVQVPGDAEGARTRVQRADVLVTITGANVTRCAWVVEQPSEAYVSQHVALARPLVSDLAPFLHLWLLNEAGGRRQLKHAAYGLGKPGLSLSDIGQVRVPLPPEPERSELIRVAATSAEPAKLAGQTVETNVRALGELQRSILAKAFRGELVPQDPNDEPAAVMLARLKAQAEAGASTRPSARRRTREADSSGQAET